MFGIADPLTSFYYRPSQENKGQPELSGEKEERPELSGEDGGALFHLPPEILDFHILTLLSIKDLAQFDCLCKKALDHTPAVWQVFRNKHQFNFYFKMSDDLNNKNKFEICYLVFKYLVGEPHLTKEKCWEFKKKYNFTVAKFDRLRTFFEICCQEAKPFPSICKNKTASESLNPSQIAGEALLEAALTRIREPENLNRVMTFYTIAFNNGFLRIAVVAAKIFSSYRFTFIFYNSPNGQKQLVNLAFKRAAKGDYEPLEVLVTKAPDLIDPCNEEQLTYPPILAKNALDLYKKRAYLDSAILFDEAMEAYESQQSKFPLVWLYEAIEANYFANFNERAAQLFDQLMRASEEEGVKPSSIPYLSAALSNYNIGDYKKSAFIFDHIIDESCTDKNTLNIAIHANYYAEFWDRTIQLSEQFRSLGEGEELPGFILECKKIAGLKKFNKAKT